MPIPWCAIAISYNTILKTNVVDGILEVKRTWCGLNKRVSQKSLNRFLRNKHNKNKNSINPDESVSGGGGTNIAKRKSQSNAPNENNDSTDGSSSGGVLSSLFSALFKF